MMTAPVSVAAPARSELLAGLFPLGVCASESRLPIGRESLYYEEAQAIGVGASAKRASEFATGRLCARQVLAELGVYGFPVRRNVDRSPRWPGGIVGSITHTVGFCGAVAVEQRRFAGLGVDAEVTSRVTPELWCKILTAAENAALEARAPEDRDWRAAAIFSAKESFFKAQWPLTSRWIGFEEVEIELYPDVGDEHHGTFLVRPHSTACRGIFPFDAYAGRFRLDGNLVVTGIALERAPVFS
jgi:4'-phosphopantetheinyl transferase EntD